MARPDKRRAFLRALIGTGIRASAIERSLLQDKERDLTERDKDQLTTAAKCIRFVNNTLRKNRSFRVESPNWPDAVVCAEVSFKILLFNAALKDEKATYDFNALEVDDIDSLFDVRQVNPTDYKV